MNRTAVAAGYLRVTNWRKYQHYTNRRPPWIKLHLELLDDYEFGRLQDASKAHALCIMLLAASTDNHFPNDAAWISKKISATHKLDLAGLLSTGFLERCDCGRCASTPLAPGKQLDLLETEKSREEGETEGEGAPAGPASAPRADRKAGWPPEVGVPGALNAPAFLVAWSRRLAERGELAPSKRPGESNLRSQLAQLEKLAAARGLEVAIACVERATSGGHQGVVFPEDFQEGRNGSARGGGVPTPSGKVHVSHGLSPELEDLGRRMEDGIAAQRQREEAGDDSEEMIF